MKKLLGIFLVLALLAGGVLAESQEWKAAPGSPAEAYGEPAPGNRLGYILLKELHSSGKNCVLSPYSLALALGMAADGAAGETREQLLNALGAEDTEILTAAIPEGIHSANAIFAKPGLELKDAYLEQLERGYSAEQFKIDSSVVKKVNRWVKKNTDGLIEELLSSPPGDEISLLLINAIAMDADWENPFAAESTSGDSFHAAGGDVQVQMMRQTDMFDYAEKDGVQIIRLPYAGSNLEMWIALPAAEGAEGLQMPELLEALANEGSFYLASDARRTKVRLSLPKFDVSDENSLVQAMQQLGVEAPFGDAADFSQMSDMPMKIDEIIQKARVQVDEAGTRAAAATMIAMEAMAAPGMMDEPVEMRVDRPFAFAIVDGESGIVCFAGVIENPAA